MPSLLTDASTPLPTWLDESVAADTCAGQLPVVDLLRCLGFPDTRTHDALLIVMQEVAGHLLRAAPGASGTIHQFVRWGDIEPVWQRLQAAVDLGIPVRTTVAEVSAPTASAPSIRRGCASGSCGRSFT